MRTGAVDADADVACLKVLALRAAEFSACCPRMFLLLVVNLRLPVKLFPVRAASRETPEFERLGAGCGQQRGGALSTLTR